MSLNIFQIWDKLGRQVPFAVKRDHWPHDHYAVVENVECTELPYGKAFGYHTIAGVLSDRFDYDKDWIAEKIIPCCGSYQWTLAENVEINKGKTIITKIKNKFTVAYAADAELNFGKYKGRTVKEAFELDPGYVQWALVFVEKFCLTTETFELFNSDFKFSNGVGQLNKDKLLLVKK